MSKHPLSALVVAVPRAGDELGFADRPRRGTTLPYGLVPDDVVRRVLEAIENARPEPASTDFIPARAV